MLYLHSEYRISQAGSFPLKVNYRKLVSYCWLGRDLSVRARVVPLDEVML